MVTETAATETPITLERKGTIMKSKSLAAVLTAAAIIAAPFLGMADAQAGKSVKCVSRPVAGQVGTYIWTCSSIRA